MHTNSRSLYSLLSPSLYACSRFRIRAPLGSLPLFLSFSATTFETAWAGTYEFDYAAAGVFAVEPLAHVEEWGYVVVDKCGEGV